MAHTAIFFFIGNPSNNPSIKCVWKMFDYHTPSGPDGSRTRVRKPIPRPSTSVVCSLTFPPPDGNKHPAGFGSFMIRPYAQSFACVVSHIVEAGSLMCECTKADCRHIRQRMLNYLQRLNFIWPFNASPCDSLLRLQDPRRNLNRPSHRRGPIF